MKDKSKSIGKWRTKLEKEQEPKVVVIPPKMQKRHGRGTMLISTPMDVDVLIRKVKKGKLVTQEQIRDKLAKDFNAGST